MAVVEVQDLWKCFVLHHLRPRTMKEMLVQGWGEAEVFWALRALNLQVAPGEAVGIIGSNGSGKSTLLKLIAGILRPDRGQLSVSGRVSALLELGAGFHPDFSGRENVFLNGIMLGLTRRAIADSFDDIVNFAEMERFIDTPVKHYSSGMFMRLAFSVAVHVDPDVLLIDEVLAVGDARFHRKCWQKIEALRNAGRTLIFVSHDLAAVRRICERLIWLDGGAKRAEGDVEEVIGAYEAAMLGGEVDAPIDNIRPAARWGTREAEITGVRWLDAGGKERRSFRADEPMTLELAYLAHQPIADAAFGIGIWRDDGSYCYGASTHLDGLAVPVFVGPGQVALHFDAIHLFAGIYRLDVAIHHVDETAYDFHNRGYPFRILSDERGHGIYSPPHRWELWPDSIPVPKSKL